MNEQLIQYETAILAKKKGFDEPVWDFIDTYGETDCIMGFIGDTFEDKYNLAKYYIEIPLPSQAILQKWLREVHGIHIEVLLTDESPYKEFYMRVMRIGKYFTLAHDGIYRETYEKALEAGLFEALKLI